MSSIHIARNGQNLGSFYEGEIREGLLSQRFLPEDLFWRSGMSEWRPLRELPEDISSAPVLSEEISTDATELTHILAVAWEKRSEIGYWKAFVQTVYAVLFAPTKLFSNIYASKELKAPLFFYSIIFVLIMPFSCAYQILQYLKTSLLFGLSFPELSHTTGIALIILFTLLSFVIALLNLFLVANFLQLSLRLLHAEKKPLLATFRMMLYSSGARLTSIVLFFAMTAYLYSQNRFLETLVFLTTITTIFWSGAIFCIGLKRVQQLSTGKLLVTLFLTGCFLIFSYTALVLGGMGIGHLIKSLLH